MTEKEFEALEKTHTVVAKGWSSENFSIVSVLGNEHGSPIALRYSSNETGYEFAYINLVESKVEAWVPVTAQLPPHDENDKHSSVLVDVFGDGERWPECYYCFLEDEWICNELGEPVSIATTHWKAITYPSVE